MLQKEILFDIAVTNARVDEVLEYVLNSLENRVDPYYIVTPNPEMIMYSQKDSSFKSVLNGARIALCDGVGLLLASKLLKKPIKARITGVDFMEKVCKDSVRISKNTVRKPVTVGFLGGKDGVAEKAAECLVRKYPMLEIGFIASEWSDTGFDAAQKFMVRVKHPKLQVKADRYEKYNEAMRSNVKSVDILFVAFGFPKQELWMQEHVGSVPATVMMGVGGAFDYLGGNVSRAPSVVRSLGFEWLYRLFRQPWRLRRQLALFSFIFLVLREKLNR